MCSVRVSQGVRVSSQTQDHPVHPSCRGTYASPTHPFLKDCLSVRSSASVIHVSLAPGPFRRYLMVLGSPPAHGATPHLLQPSSWTTHRLFFTRNLLFGSYQGSLPSRMSLGSLIPWVVSDFFRAESNNTLQSLFRNSLGNCCLDPPPCLAPS